MANLSNLQERTIVGDVRTREGGPVEATPPNAATVWRRILPTAQEVRSARRRLHGKAILIASLLAVEDYVLVISNLALIRAGAA